MSLFVKTEKRFAANQAAVYQAALGAISGLEGKLTRQDVDKGVIEAKFDKKILGRVLGDRTQLQVTLLADGEACKVIVEAFPLDAIGRRLMFGARAGVTETVVDWFFAHLEHRLKPQTVT
ncbi:MAG: hypothetical protein KIH69_008310 [Anaerolineae bacterium]|nr:hypothetical protein [Anaerolineae bacterium]